MSAKKGTKKSGAVRRNTPDPARLEKEKREKRQTAYVFACAGGILWVVPAVSSLALGIVTDGMSPGFALAIAALVLGIPNSLFAINAYKKKCGRPAVIVFDCLLAVLCGAAAFFVRPWSLILAPAFILLIVMIAVSDVIENR